MDLPHFMASGMGGIRSAGDLVARMEFGKNMRVKDAKAYVAKKLGTSASGNTPFISHACFRAVVQHTFEQ